MIRQLNLRTVGRSFMQGLRSSRFSSKKDINVPKVKNFINGKFVDSLTTKWIPLYNPGNLRAYLFFSDIFWLVASYICLTFKYLYTVMFIAWWKKSWWILCSQLVYYESDSSLSDKDFVLNCHARVMMLYVAISNWTFCYFFKSI